MRSMPRSVRFAVLTAITAALLPVGHASGAEYFGQTSASLQITDADGAPLPSAVTDTSFVEAAISASVTGPGIPFGRSQISRDTTEGFVDGVRAVLGLAGASTGAPSQVEARWLGGVLVQSSASVSVLANVSVFSVVAGNADVPEEVASSAVTLDLVFGAVDPACIGAVGTITRGVDLDCFEVLLRLPLDEQHGVALPNFLTHTTLLGDDSVDLAIDIVQATSGSPAPLDTGAARQAIIGISADTPVLVGLEATVAGDAAVTNEPRCFGEVATILGTAADDEIRGTDHADVILGLGGDDVITGKAGNDRICGGDGDDRLIGHKHDDWIAGEGGNDKIDGYYGDDFITGGPGNDFIQGCDGVDVVHGDAGDDTLRGERGDDLILGGTGNDNIKGASGSDVVIGGQAVAVDISVALRKAATIHFASVDESDDDQVNGDRNADVVEGGPGNDVLKGGKGDDVIAGGSGTDTIYGGGGSLDACIDDGADTMFFECE